MNEIANFKDSLLFEIQKSSGTSAEEVPDTA